MYCKKNLNIKMTWQEGLLPTAAANIRGVHLEEEKESAFSNTHTSEPEFLNF
jgi:hypothetical protein